MKVDTAFFRSLSTAAFDSLAEYYETMESQLASMKDRDRKRIYKDLSKLGLSGEEKYREWDLAMQDHSAKYDMLFTNFSRYSFVVLLVIVLENWLHRLCLAVDDIRHPAGVVPATGEDTIRKHRDYLKKAGVLADNSLWDDVFDLVKIRHCIVHASGNTDHSKYQLRLRDISRKGVGLSISDHTYRNALTPLYLETGMLMIEPRFCRSMIAKIKTLFGTLCDSVPLYEMSFVSLATSDSKESVSNDRRDRPDESK